MRHKSVTLAALSNCRLEQVQPGSVGRRGGGDHHVSTQALGTSRSRREVCRV